MTEARVWLDRVWGANDQTEGGVAAGAWEVLGPLEGEKARGLVLGEHRSKRRAATGPRRKRSSTPWPRFVSWRLDAASPRSSTASTSSRCHAVVYDWAGRLSDFLRDFHALMAKYGNTRDGVENQKFWSAQESEAVEIGDMDTLVGCIAYTLANPTKDFIVERPEEWNGVMTPVESLGSGVGKVYAL